MDRTMTMQNILEFSDHEQTDSDTGSVNVLAESSGWNTEPLHKGASIAAVDFKIFRRRIEKYADEWARKYVAPALAGNEEAAFSLAAALSNKKRGDVTVAFWRARAPRGAFRQLLNIVWSHDHAELIKAAGSRRRLSAIFRYAQFSTEGLPPVVLVWRGASGLGCRMGWPRVLLDPGQGRGLLVCNAQGCNVRIACSIACGSPKGGCRTPR